MSNTILPSLPGLGIKVQRELLTNVLVQESASGKQYRSSYWTSPRYRYRLGIDFARWHPTYQEVQSLVSHFARHFGSLDSFLFQDPDDCSVSDHGFAAGDGATKTFQLQRTLGGSYTDALGTYAIPTKPRTNLCLRSQEFDNAFWSAVAGGVGVAPIVTANVGVAPDGTVTADRVQLSLGGGSTASDYSRMQAAGITHVSGSTYCWSVWLRTEDGSTKTVRLEVSGAAVQLVTVTGTWQRFSTSWAASGSLVYYPRVGLVGGSTSATASLLVWGAQYEAGTSTPTAYIPTTSSSVTSTPAYWPAYSGGYEPVWEPDWATVGITLEGDWQGKRALYPWARTNLCIQSQTLGTSWQNLTNPTTVTENSTAAPDGTNTADTLTDTAANAPHELISPAMAASVGIVYTESVYLKAGTLNFARLRNGGTANTAVFNLSTGTVVTTTGTGTTATITSVGNGWYRCTMTFTSSATTAYLVICLSADGSTFTYAGGSGTIYAWGAQLETGSVATSYIPTTTAAVTVTDYTMGSLGALTLATAPASGTCLAWTGQYRRRVKFAESSLSAEQIVRQLWKSSLTLESVFP